MNVLPLNPANGLAPSELATLIIFAARAGLQIETGRTEEGWGYAALDLGAALGLPSGVETWTISREKRSILAFNEREGLLAPSRTIADLLATLSLRLPANSALVG